MRLKRSMIGGAAALAMLSPAVALAQSPSPWPLWELGAFSVGVSQQAYPGSDERVNRGLALPFFVYRGRFLRADRETAGLRVVKTSRFGLDIGVAGSFAARSDEIEARRGMPDLGTLVESGPRVKWNLGDGPGGGAWRLPSRAISSPTGELSASRAWTASATRPTKPARWWGARRGHGGLRRRLHLDAF